MIQNKKQKNSGYTLLFAVLVSSLVLSVGISILTISKKEFLLASAARESTSAFYAADGALECVVYEVDKNRFSTSSVDTTSPVCGSIGVGSSDCNYTGRGVKYCAGSGDEGTFTINIPPNNTDISQACAVVSVRKYYYDDPFDTPDFKSLPVTSITARGYSRGWDDTALCNTPSPNRVERVLYYSK